MTTCGVDATFGLIAKILPSSLATSICAAARLPFGPMTNAPVGFETMPVIAAPVSRALLAGANFDGEPSGATTEMKPVALFAIQKDCESIAMPQELTTSGLVCVATPA